MLLWLFLLLLALVLFNLGLARFIERLVPPLGRFIEVDGLRLHIVDSGARPGQSEPPLLFVHGMLAQLNQYSFALSALFPERRVVLLDRPGCGYSQAAPSQGIRAQADITAQVINRLGLRKPLVVGHSFGGAIALALALDHGERIGGLALIAPLTHPVEGQHKALIELADRGRLAFWLGAWTLGPIVSLSRIGKARQMIFAPEPVIPGFWIRAGGFLAMRPPPIVAAVRELNAIPQDLPGMTERYASLDVPVGVLFGRGDVVLDAQAQGPVFCAKAPTAELTMIEGGHMLTVTQPKVTEAFIRTILARLEAVR